MASERIQKVQSLRDLFGATANFIDITRAELSDEKDTLGSGEFKTKMFNMAKAKTLVDTFDAGKLNKATFMIRSDPPSLMLEKKLQQQLASCKSHADANKAFNTIASVRITVHYRPVNFCYEFTHCLSESYTQLYLLNICFRICTL